MNPNLNQPETPNSSANSPIQSSNTEPRQNLPLDTTNSYNVLSIIGFILAYVMPIVGLIVSIIGLVQLNRKKQKGRVLAILGIIISSLIMVISIIGLIILLALYSTVGNITSKDGKSITSDIKRQDDISAIQFQLDSYYSINKFYPTYADMNDDAWLSANMPNLNIQSLTDPPSLNHKLAATPDKFSYSYTVTPTGCSNTDVMCSAYSLSTYLDNGSTFDKTSLKVF